MSVPPLSARREAEVRRWLRYAREELGMSTTTLAHPKSCGPSRLHSYTLIRQYSWNPSRR